MGPVRGSGPKRRDLGELAYLWADSLETYLAALGRLVGTDRHLVEEFDTLLSLLEKSSIPMEAVDA